MVWQTTSMENKQLKETLLEKIRGQPNNEIEYGQSSSFYKLLIDDL